MRFFRISLGLLLFSLVSGTAYGHGVTHGFIHGGAVAVKLTYSGGEPFSYSQVKVFGPGDDLDLEFQNGRTDARGVFAFVPDRPGTWRIVAWDESGHRSEVTFEQPTSAQKPPASTPIAHRNSAFNAFFGLSILLNITLGVLLTRKNS